jgi:predicted ATPase
MISLIEALNYRSLRYVRQPLSPFQILIGPNGSGKTALLEIPSFLAHLIELGLDLALGGDDRITIPLRATHARQLLWKQQGQLFELAVELPIPKRLARGNGTTSQQVCRYELAIDAVASSLAAENLFLIPQGDHKPRPPLEVFPSPRTIPSTILLGAHPSLPTGWQQVISRNQPDKATYLAETSNRRSTRKLLAGRTALASLPDDPERFPVACWFRDQLIGQMQRLVLSGEHMRLPCSFSRQWRFRADGSNLPWVLHRLRQNPARFAQWLAHLQEALPEVSGVTTVLREPDSHRYLTARVAEDVALPSWALSDGTLRLLALTVLAYVDDLNGSYLIEEPENGIPPKAMESVFQSLSSVPNAQIFCTTHSPALLGLASPAQLLCFAKTADGSTDVIQGDQHPVLRDWQGTIDLQTLFASGVLG